MYPRDRIFQACLLWIQDLADHDIEPAADYVPMLRDIQRRCRIASVLEVVDVTIAVIERMQNRRGTNPHPK
jgi:hypothetical protein